jgi:integrase
MRKFLQADMGRATITVHGFRSSFRDWAAESTAYPGEVVEMALAHTIKNKAEAAYRRGDLLAKRAKLMQAWADYLQREPITTNVASIRKVG